MRQTRTAKAYGWVTAQALSFDRFLKNTNLRALY